MTTQKNSERDDVAVSEEAVADYLRGDAEFFVRRPELLSGLTVPHLNGPAASLIERQVMQLRKQNRDLNAQLHELISVAKDNEALSIKLHNLTLSLIGADGYEAVHSLLNVTLLNEFDADRVSVLIFAEASCTEGSDRTVFKGARAAEREAFADLLDQGQPICGGLDPTRGAALFGDKGVEIASAVMMPLAHAKWRGVLAVGARDPRKYHSDMGIELLARFAQIASVVLDPWVKKTGVNKMPVDRSPVERDHGR